MNKVLPSKFSELTKDRQKHCKMQSDLAELLCYENKVLQPYREKLVDVAMLHDIGYAKSLQFTGFHPIDGAIFLKQNKIKLDTICIIAHHSNAVDLLPSITPTGIKKATMQELYKLFPKGKDSSQKLLLEILDLLDSRVDADGDIVTLNERIRDIGLRHGKASLAYKVVKSNQHRLETLAKKYKFDKVAATVCNDADSELDDKEESDELDKHSEEETE